MLIIISISERVLSHYSFAPFLALKCKSIQLYYYDTVHVGPPA